MQFLKKTMKHVRKCRFIKIVTTGTKKNYLVFKAEYHATKFFKENLLAKEIKITETLLNNCVGLEVSIQELIKILMYVFWYIQIKLKYGEKVESCYMDTDSFILYIKADSIYKDIAEDVETRFDTELERLLPKGKKIKKQCDYLKMN